MEPISYTYFVKQNNNDMTTANYINRATGATYQLGGVNNLEQAWSLMAWVCNRNSWNTIDGHVKMIFTETTTELISMMVKTTNDAKRIGYAAEICKRAKCEELCNALIAYANDPKAF